MRMNPPEAQFGLGSCSNISKAQSYLKAKRAQAGRDASNTPFGSFVSRVVGIDFQVGEKKRLGARPMTAAVGLDSHEYRVNLR
jgi:hypothetical protein